MEPTIREYEGRDEQEWMIVHAIILSTSHAWNYTIQQRPVYKNDSVKLVALDGEKIVGVMDIEIESEPGKVCLLKDSVGGYVLEFGRLPEYAGHNIGKALIEHAKTCLTAKGVHRMEFWSQDENALRYYEHLGMKEINRHYRFRIKPSRKIKELLERDFVGCEYIYGACVPEIFDEVGRRYEVIKRHPLEPHLCVGHEIRF
jgi:ribosomal protein S18 acetylase RimI-like enzyme